MKTNANPLRPKPRVVARQVAFLRGVNVGGNRIIKSTALKECFEDLGFGNVAVVLQSGNVIFTSERKTPGQNCAIIEEGLTKRFEYPAKAIVKTIDEVAGIVDRYPFKRLAGDQHYVVFLSQDVRRELLGLALDQSVEVAEAGEMVIYWKARKGSSGKSEFAKLLAKVRYREVNTVRNVNTLEKVVAIAAR